MIDPLAQIVTLLKPGAQFSKRVSGAGRWIVHRAEHGRPYYCAILEGGCRLATDGHPPITLQENDFVLIPSAYNFTMSSLQPAEPEDIVGVPTVLPGGEYRIGVSDAPAEVRLVLGYCVFQSPDADLLASLLPTMVHVRDDKRLTTLVQLVGDEARANRPARDVVLEHLLEVLLIEALRSDAGTTASPGLLRGLSDERLTTAIRQMHENPTEPWTVVRLAKEAALSRSVFFERFRRAVGVAPMEYLLSWRMALAKDLLCRKNYDIADVAERVGYSSASTFTVAFTRHTGMPPARYARAQKDR